MMNPIRTPQAEAAGNSIKLARRALLWSQRELADVAGVPFTVVSFIESGYQIPQEALDKIIAALEGKTDE